MGFQIVLVEPQIPPNTGNVGRLCIATKSRLHLVKPLGFDLSEKAVRRAGLDYWKHIDLVVHESYADFQRSLSTSSKLWFFTKFAEKSLYRASFNPGDYLVFGRETTGLTGHTEGIPREQLLRIPMPGNDIVRSLNLAGSVHIALYEALRQTEFESL